MISHAKALSGFIQQNVGRPDACMTPNRATLSENNASSRERNNLTTFFQIQIATGAQVLWIADANVGITIETPRDRAQPTPPEQPSP
jgi:hypothetical protein